MLSLLYWCILNYYANFYSYVNLYYYFLSLLLKPFPHFLIAILEIISLSAFNYRLSLAVSSLLMLSIYEYVLFTLSIYSYHFLCTLFQFLALWLVLYLNRNLLSLLFYCLIHFLLMPLFSYPQCYSYAWYSIFYE